MNTRTMQRSKTVGPPVAFGFDVAAVLLFVAIGRRSHDESGSAISGIVAVAAPLLIGLVVGWLIALRSHRSR